METGKRRRRPRRRSLSAPDERAPRLPASSGPLSIALVPLALTATALVAYQPAWHGDLLWDDAAHMARADLRSPEGLWRIWFDLTATQQYYPLTHSAFWVMARLWGASTLGYHLVNILLHALSATLVVVILSYFLTNRLVTPLTRLKWQLKKIEKRQFDDIEPIQATGEIKEVAQSVYDMAAELERYITSQQIFFQNASHELKTPLMTIQGYAEGIKEKVFDPEEEEKGLEVMVTEVKRLKKIINELTTKNVYTKNK